MEDQNEKNLGTALAVVEAQQKVVGSSLVATSNSALLAESTDSQSQILEQIRDIQVKTLRGIGNVVDQLKKSLGFDQNQARLDKQNQTELDKENQGDQLAPGSAGIEAPEDEKKGGGGLFGFLGMLPGAGFIKKLFAPIIAFFGKGGMLVKLFGRFGPLGLLILGFTLIYKYSDQIAKALAPALTKIKEIIVKLKPVTDFLMKLGDFLIKELIAGIGKAFEYLFGGVERLIDGFKKLFDGDIIGGLKDIFGGLFDMLLAVPKAVIGVVGNILSPLAEAIGNFFSQLYTDIETYITNTITGISDWFGSLVDGVVGFFTMHYEAAKENISRDIDQIFTFFSDIFTSVADFFSSAYTKIKDFVTSIPDKIMSFVKNMFAPIVNFFSGIGNAIKKAINGIIDALPIPSFVKDKIKFDTTPTYTEDPFEVEKAEMPKLNKGRSINQELGDNKDMINEYASTRGMPLNIQQTLLANADRKPDQEKTLVFGGMHPGAYTDMIPLSNLENAIAKIKETGFTVKAQRAAETPKPKLNADDIKAPEESKTVNVINKGGDTVQQSNVSSKSDIYSGQLATVVDPFHDRNAVGVGT